ASRGGGGGLSKPENRTSGLLIAYSTAPGFTASDGDGPDSPYTTALAEAIKTHGLIAEQLFKRVADRVRAGTGGKQQPFYESGLTGEDFCFAGCGVPSQETRSAPPTQIAGLRNNVSRSPDSSHRLISSVISIEALKDAEATEIAFPMSYFS